MSSETLINNRYRLISQQGSGGMAVIYRAMDEALGRTVALKVLRPSLTAEPAFISRFQNEARSIANLQHPNIVTVYDVGSAVTSTGDVHYIVMEFIDGNNLKEFIRSHGGALSVDKAIKIAIGIASGLGFAHRKKIVHADVKPQNILLTTDHQVKITDFGIAQAWSDTQPSTRQSVVWGSPHYFAPEQAQGEKPSAASDVYSIGIVMFEMLTGRLPYVGTDQKELALAHIRERIPIVTEFNPAVPETFSRIVYKTMSKEPRDRYRMADQLAHILESFQKSWGQDTLTTEPPNINPPESHIPPPPASNPTVARNVSNQNQQIPRPPQGGAIPTQRYSPAPQAPNTNSPHNRIPAPSDSRPVHAQNNPGYGQVGIGADSRPLNPPSRPYGQQSYQNSEPVLWDNVTIALAIIAFLAVACLVPLWIAVFIERV